MDENAVVRSPARLFDMCIELRGKHIVENSGSSDNTNLDATKARRHGRKVGHGATFAKSVQGSDATLGLDHEVDDDTACCQVADRDLVLHKTTASTMHTGRTPTQVRRAGC